MIATLLRECFAPEDRDFRLGCRFWVGIVAGDSDEASGVREGLPSSPVPLMVLPPLLPLVPAESLPLLFWLPLRDGFVVAKVRCRSRGGLAVSAVRWKPRHVGGYRSNKAWNRSVGRRIAWATRRGGCMFQRHCKTVAIEGDNRALGYGGRETRKEDM